MKLRAKIVLALTALGALSAMAPAAHAAGQVCYDVQLNVGGQTVAQADCVDTP